LSDVTDILLYLKTKHKLTLAFDFLIFETDSVKQFLNAETEKSENEVSVSSSYLAASSEISGFQRREKKEKALSLSMLDSYCIVLLTEQAD
jgi:hypothetical protein